MTWALVTGASARGGAAIARALHARGRPVLLHHSGRSERARDLAAEFNTMRPGSARTWAWDFTQPDSFNAAALHERPIDVAVCAASCYRPSALGDAAAAWSDLQVHVLAHARLLDALRPTLASVVAVTDVHVQRPAPGYLWYTVSKASLQSLVLTLAVEWAPRVRCNVVQPGTLPYPDNWSDGHRRAAIEASIPLQRTGSFDDLAGAATWLALDAPYVTGQILAVDGGRSVWLP